LVAHSTIDIGADSWISAMIRISQHGALSGATAPYGNLGRQGIALSRARA
jgi:hypothetical protein